jgi:hypothetical protein
MYEWRGQDSGAFVSNLNARNQTGAINLKIFPPKQVELNKS